MMESIRSAQNPMDDPEYRFGFANSFMNASVAAQIKAIREQRDLTQSELAEMIGTKQAGISRLENVNYDAWKVTTLTRIARAFDVRLKITFEEFDTLPDEVKRFNRANLERQGYVQRKNESQPETIDLTEAENRAMNPAAKQNVKTTPNLFVVPANNDPGKEKKAEETDAPDFNSARQSASLPGMGKPQFKRKAPSSDYGSENNGEMPIPELSTGTETI